MKKFVLVTLAALTLGALAADTAQAAEKDYGAAVLLSSMFPGAGEWYNSGWEGGFPLVECIAGAICPCIRVASMMDAADGNAEDGLRIDFWSAPNK